MQTRLLGLYGGLYLGRRHSQSGRFPGCRCRSTKDVSGRAHQLISKITVLESVFGSAWQNSYADSSADVRSVELPQHRAAEILQLAAAGLLSRRAGARHWQTKNQETGLAAWCRARSQVCARLQVEPSCIARSVISDHWRGGGPPGRRLRSASRACASAGCPERRASRTTGERDSGIPRY